MAFRVQRLPAALWAGIGLILALGVAVPLVFTWWSGRTGPIEPAPQPVPPGLDVVALNTTTKSYLEAQIGKGLSRHKVFCGYGVLGIEGLATVDEYLEVYCQAYYVEDGVLTRGTGSKGPVRLILRELDGAYVAVDHRVPRDGSHFSSDVRTLFPAALHERIFGRDIQGYLYIEGYPEAEAARFFQRG